MPMDKPLEAVEAALEPINTRKQGKETAATGKAKNKRQVASEKVASERQAMRQFRQRILRSPKSPRVLDSIFDAALDKEDPHRAVAWKLLIDRFAPIRDFERDQLSGRSSVNITITGVESANDIQPIEGEVIEDAEIKEDACRT